MRVIFRNEHNALKQWIDETRSALCAQSHSAIHLTRSRHRIPLIEHIVQRFVNIIQIVQDHGFAGFHAVHHSVQIRIKGNRRLNGYGSPRHIQQESA